MTGKRLTVTDDGIRAAVTAERSEQADLLATLRPDQWDAPTLCAGWRVREVVAHTTMPFRASVGRTLVELVKARGRFNRMADRCARRDAAQMTSTQLLAALRDNVAHPWKPPGGGALGALSHDVIHGLDITVALRAGPPGSTGPGGDGSRRADAKEHRVLRHGPHRRGVASDRPRLESRGGNARTRAGPDLPS